jgi:hypothetical protein
MTESLTENISSPEKSVITRDQVVEAFKKFPRQGITNPDELPSDDPDVVAANQLLDDWSKQNETKPEYSFERSTIHFDSGFTDPDYLDELANDWLIQDAENAEIENPELAKKIQAKIEEINKFLT